MPCLCAEAGWFLPQRFNHDLEPFPDKGYLVKRAALYLRVSTVDQHPETQGIELRQFAQQRGYEIFREYVDHGVSGTKVRRPALDQLLKDAHRQNFDVVLVWSCDRLARSTKHFLQLLDELDELGIQFHSQREAIDTDGPLGRAIVIIISAIAELEKSLIVERVRAGMHRAKLEGRRIGRTPLDVDHAALVRDRHSGMSLTVVAKKHGLSRASVVRFAREAKAKQEHLQGNRPASNPALKIMTSEV
jgi:DNA invertase Pin-like site-specific DNA recombinase